MHEIYISEGTIKTHVADILQKLNLRDRVQAVVLAYETGLVGTDSRPPGCRDQNPTGWAPWHSALASRSNANATNNRAAALEAGAW